MLRRYYGDVSIKHIVLKRTSQHITDRMLFVVPFENQPATKNSVITASFTKNRTPLFRRHRRGRERGGWQNRGENEGEGGDICRGHVMKFHHDYTCQWQCMQNKKFSTAAAKNMKNAAIYTQKQNTCLIYVYSTVIMCKKRSMCRQACMFLFVLLNMSCTKQCKVFDMSCPI